MPFLLLSVWSFGQELKKNGGKQTFTHKDKFGGTYFRYNSNKYDTINNNKQKVRNNLEKKYKTYQYITSSFYGYDNTLLTNILEISAGFNLLFNMNIGVANYQYESFNFVNDYLSERNLRTIDNVDKIKRDFSHLNINFDAMAKLGLIYVGGGLINFNKIDEGHFITRNDLTYKHHAGYYFSWGFILGVQNGSISLGFRHYTPDGNTGLYHNNQKIKFPLDEYELNNKYDLLQKYRYTNAWVGDELIIGLIYKNLTLNLEIPYTNLNYGQINKTTISIGYNLFNFANFIAKNSKI